MSSRQPETPKGPAMSARERLLDAALELGARQGVGDRSLRQLAADLGTSHRMLIYHFGSRDGLVAEIAATIEERQRGLLSDLLADPEAPVLEQGRRFWSLVTDSALHYGPLVFELTAHAMQGRPHAAALRADDDDPWLDPLSELWERLGLDPQAARVQARLNLAVARGLLHDLLLTGDRAEVDQAMERFLEQSVARINRSGQGSRRPVDGSA